MARFELLASRQAEREVRERGLDSLPVDVLALARSERIVVLPKEAPGGASGLLIRVGDEFTIGYATHIESEGFRRFSIAHELGHYFLEGHPEKVLDAKGVHSSRAGFGSKQRHELEADHFAAGLLMPREAFKKALGSRTPGLDTLIATADLCETSLPATAIRYAQLTTDPVAVVISEGDRIDYAFMSDSLYAVRELTWIRKGDRLPLGTATRKLNADPAAVCRGQRKEAACSPADWFGVGPEVELWEEAVGLGSYGKTLTVLSANDWPDEDDGDDDVEVWDPKFHRSRRR